MSYFVSFSSLNNWCSTGRPWQSQPGTYGESNPLIVLCFTTMSFKVLFNAWPMCISPLAYGGPSCRRYFFLPSDLLRIFAYRLLSCHCFKIIGSRFGRFAFIGKSVLGKFNVFL